MNAPNFTSKRRARLRAHYPTVTLAEAMTQLAFGRPFDAPVLLRYRHRNGGAIPLLAREALDAVGQQLAALALDGKVVLRGERQGRDGGPLEEPANIPQEVFADGVHFEPSNDVIEMDCVLERHFAGAGYPRYRHVRLDARQVQSCHPVPSPGATLERRSGTPADMAAFVAWADGIRVAEGAYPSRNQAYEAFSKPKGLSRDWSRAAIAALPKAHRQGAGAPRKKN